MVGRKREDGRSSSGIFGGENTLCLSIALKTRY